MKKLIVISILMLFIQSPAHANKKVDALQKELERLNARVAELEAQQKEQIEQDMFGYPARQEYYDPFEEMERMNQQMEETFRNSFSHENPSLQVHHVFSFNQDFQLKENEKEYFVEVNMTGLDQEKLDVQVNENSITVKGEHSQSSENKSSTGSVSAQSYGMFLQTIPLPQNADTEKVRTEKKDNILKITIPKRNNG